MMTMEISGGGWLNSGNTNISAPSLSLSFEVSIKHISNCRFRGTKWLAHVLYGWIIFVV